MYAGNACWAQDASVPPEPAQNAVWQYYRPKCDGGPLQQHLDAFKGYTRYAQYPAKSLADMDWHGKPLCEKSFARKLATGTPRK